MGFEPVGWLGVVVGGIIGYVVRWADERYKTRLATIRYEIHTQQLGSSGNHPTFGEIRVLHNGNEVERVLAGTITLRNVSTKDLDGLVVSAYLEGEAMLLAHGAVKDTARLAPTQRYLQAVGNAIEQHAAGKVDAQLENALLHSVEYAVPVLNRRTEAMLTILFTGPVGCEKLLKVRIDHKGVVAIEQRPGDQFVLGEPAAASGWIGLGIALVGTYLLGLAYWGAWSPWIAVVLGLFAQIFGALVYKIVRRIRGY